MAKTFENLWKICVRRTKTDGDNDALVGFKEDLNLGLQEIGMLRNWDELYGVADLALENGTETYQLDSTVDTVEQIRLTSPVNNEIVIPRIDKEQLRAIDPVTSNSSNSVPSYWYFTEPSIDANNVETKQISFYPIPNTAYTMTYSFKKVVPLMVDPGDYPFFDSKFHHFLCDYAIWQYCLREPDETLNPVTFQALWEINKRKILSFYNGQAKRILPIPGPDSPIL